MARATDPNRALILQLIREERQAEQDRIFAARLAGMTLDPIPDKQRNRAMHFDEFDDVDTEILDSQSKPECAICMQLVSETSPRTPCGHVYCMECLKHLFIMAMQDETLMPPRCCGNPIDIALAQLTSKEIEDFNAKLVEYSTPNRLYCSQPTCSAFIPPELIDKNVGTCPKPNCGVTTCSICKAASHGNSDCPKDEATAAVRAAAREAGWCECFNCRAIIELAHGCYHMTCRCRTEFCYLCGKKWKNCECAQWDEARLLEVARDRIEREPVRQTPGATDQADLNQRVEDMADLLRNNQECLHDDTWVRISGGGQCEECNDYLPLYLYRCRVCHLMACRRCRYNRL